MDIIDLLHERECSALGCWDDATRKGMCGKHYQAARAAGELGRECDDPFCESGVVARGLCRKHYYEARKIGVVPERKETPKTCKECGAVAKARGLCNAHYSKARRNNAL